MSIRPVLASAIVLVAGLTCFAAAAHTTWLDSNCRPQMTRLQERLYEKRNESNEALRRFVLSRRSIVEVDFDETVDWALAVDDARNRCLRRVGEAQPQVAHSTDAPNPAGR